MFDLPPLRSDRPLLTTTTGEPFQPVRLYYKIPSKPFVTTLLSKLRCIEENREKGLWGWLYTAEATALTFGRTHAELPAHLAPVLLGVFRFPKQGGMTLQVRSFSRAMEAARFFGPILGPRVVARRARLINRFFGADELTENLDALDRCLDQNVTVIDPRAAEERMNQYLEGAKTPEERHQARERYYEDDRRERRDVPLVEDLPLASEEETPDFKHLSMMLRFREIRAYERWNGNAHVILRDIIERMVKEIDNDPEAGNRE